MRILVLLALGCVVSGNPAAKASSFTNTLGSLGGGELGKGNGVSIHGVWVRGGSRGG